MPIEFYSLTQNEYFLMCKGFFDKLKSERTQTEYMVRQLSWFIVRGYADPKSMPNNISDWWAIGDEEKKKAEPIEMTPERLAYLQEVINNHIEKNTIN